MSSVPLYLTKILLEVDILTVNHTLKYYQVSDGFCETSEIELLSYQSFPLFLLSYYFI